MQPNSPLADFMPLEDAQTFEFEHNSHGVNIAVNPTYVQEESGVDETGEDRGHVWMYHIKIENKTQESLQLTSRYWRIISSNGQVEEVHGEGVVGEKPVLHPGETYEYASATALSAPSGFMEGCYDMQKPDGAKVQVEIPSFSLDIPGTRSSVN